MKKTLVLGLATFLTGGISHGAISVSSDLTFASEYIFRGVQLADNTLHPSIELSENDWYLGYWGAMPAENKASKGWVDEYDFYAGYGIELSETTSVDLGATYYYYTAGGSTFEPYVGISSDLGTVTPSLYVYYDIDLKNITVQGSIGTSLPLESIGSSVDLSGTVGYVNVDSGDSYAYYGGSAVIPFEINEQATVSFGVHWYDNDVSGYEGDTFYFTIGGTVAF